MEGLSLNRLARAVQQDAAIRRVRRLQPVGGKGDKIYPPTYPGEGRNPLPRHVFERRRVNGENVQCVLIDSVQSQANRLEEALRAKRDAGKLSFPAITVDFSKTEVGDIGLITSLDAPHRVFDAIIRDSELDQKRFRETAEGKRLVEAKSTDARAVFELSPTALVFGAWNSTGEGGGLGAKFPRALVSEIVGFGVAEEKIAGTDDTRPSGQRTGSRIDPLGIRSGVRVYKKPNGDWTLEKPAKGTKDVKEVKPSEVNHSNIAPSVTPLGVSCDYAQHVFVLSCAALRRLRFGQGPESEAADTAARSVLAGLGLCAVAAQDRTGYFLRSRCDLVPEEGAATGFEIVLADGKIERFDLDLDAAAKLLVEAVEAARKVGVTWRSDDLVLYPRQELVQLVKRSREKALQGESEPEDEG